LSSKIIAAIGEAVPILAYTGKLAGIKVTGPEVERRRLEELGAIFTGNYIEINNNFITSRGPETIREFTTAIINTLDWTPHPSERVYLR
jgi:putative intracellular protease/amidase